MKAGFWRVTGKFCLVAFWLDFSIGMFAVAIPFLSIKFGAESGHLGYLSASRSLAYCLGCYGVALFIGTGAGAPKFLRI